MTSNKQIYAEFCANKDVLVFQTPMWLDQVAGGTNWDVVLAFQGKFLSGAFPYVTNTKLGLKQITLPFLTPYLGPILSYPSDLSENNKLSFKKKTLETLIEQLPKTDRCITQTDFDFDYWLPFYWKGFQQTTRYSFVLNTAPTENELLANFKPSIRKHIKKASTQFSIEHSDSIDHLFELHQSDLQSKKVELYFNKEQLHSLDQELKTTQSSITLHAINDAKEVICAFYLVLDAQFTHYLIGAVKPEYRNSGVMSLLMWEAIKIAKGKGLTFNFEGSMDKNIGRFFSSFGSTPKPFMKISKTSNKWLKQFTRFNH